MGGLAPMPTIPSPFTMFQKEPPPDNRKRIIIGGKMNPMQLGHLALVETMLDAPIFPKSGGMLGGLMHKLLKHRVGFDEVLLCPDAVPPWLPQEDLAPWQDRMDIIKHTTKHNPRIKVLDVCKRLFDKMKTETRTVDVLRELYDGFDSMFDRTGKRAYVGVGADVLRHLDKWKAADVVAKNVTFVVAERDGADYPKEITVNGVTIPLSTMDVPFTPLPFASKEIRRRVRAGESIKGMMHPAGEQIVHERRLYLPPLTPPPGEGDAAAKAPDGTTAPPEAPKPEAKDPVPGEKKSDP